MSHLSKEALEKIYDKISPFEFKEHLIELAHSNQKVLRILDAGRGNPNWTATTPREAFFTFGQFGVVETQRTWKEVNLAGMIQKKGIAGRLKDYLEHNHQAPGKVLIEQIVNYGVTELGFNADDWVYELADGIIGDNYPFPDRSLIHIEKIVKQYLIKVLCQNKTIEGDFDVFGVEGGSAAMCYLFDSLFQNELLHKGDKIALMTPIFTPYLEIPHLPNYAFEVVQIHANGVDENGELNYQYSQAELDKLKDKDIKVLFIVNPNNPLSVAMNNESKAYLIETVKKHHPDLMIVTDDVYGTFVEDFSSLVGELPYNTMCVYSLSKYFGVTGWRLGTLMLHQNNVFNDLIEKLPQELKETVNKRYEHLSTEPESVSFIDRLVADSRLVALNHTAGLSTPQQVQMAFFCAFDLLDEQNNYKKLTMTICKRRKELLFEGLDLDLEHDVLDASYYTEINILEWATKLYGKEFAEHIEREYKPLDILYRLAKDYGIILLRGDGFASSKWGLRVSLANLKDEDYYTIGKVIRQLKDNLIDEWSEKKAAKVRKII